MNFNQSRQKLVAKIEDYAEQHPPKTNIKPILRAYFEATEVEDLQQHLPQDLLGAVISHLDFAQHRPANSVKLRIYQPDIDRDGWQSPHSIIEIVSEDRPFLISSLTLWLARHRLRLHSLIHPVLAVVRDANGSAQSIQHREQNGQLESFIHAQIDRLPDVASSQQLEKELADILEMLRIVVEDGDAMRQNAIKIAQHLETHQNMPLPDAAECAQFLRWLADGHFLFMGYFEDATPMQNPLGIIQHSPKYAQAFAAQNRAAPAMLLLNRTDIRSKIHRAAYLDSISVPNIDAQGNIVSISRFLGLYTAKAHQSSPSKVPFLRQKIEQVMQNLDYLPTSHKAKMLRFVLENYPREELFETPADILAHIAEGLVNLQERPRTRLFTRVDPYDDAISCLIFIPRDSFNTELRLKIERYLMQTLGGVHAEFNVMITDWRLARVTYRIRTSTRPNIDNAQLEQHIAQMVRGWSEELRQALIDARGEAIGNQLFAQYSEAFPAAYREEFEPRSAVLDILQLEQLQEPDDLKNLSAGNHLALKLYRPWHRQSGRHHLKVFRLGEPVSLSESLPLLESLGIRVRDERPYRVSRADGAELWINDFGLLVPDETRLDNPEIRAKFQALLLRLFSGAAECDGFNRLALAANLDWQEIALMRALAKYLRQGGLKFSQQYIENTLVNYADLSAKLIALFHARFSPENHNPQTAAQWQQHIQEGLRRVTHMDEDQILNAFVSLILAMVRTNFYQKPHDHLPCLAFKIASNRVDFLPPPHPLFETWLYSPQMEGIHLRGSKIARGGVRWSDRIEDFRSEVLALLRAQMMKNSIIVPTGAKGGFIVKQASSADRETWLAEGLSCYRLFISGLLSLTDNFSGGQICSPQRTICHDDADPYLVVAADKGTAGFSDTANEVSLAHGFWLGDAFASGGSRGYNHKKMGITARGAWESIKRNFRHLNADIERDALSVVGIGDMSGDVFGNGMLLSQTILLKAAFDHRHIFLDPAPDAAVSFAERARLFALPHSSWADYDKNLISAGGGVFDRHLKRIPISPEVGAWLSIDDDFCPPDVLIRKILCAPVDLIYNGGIGTYVKASHENHLDANDRSNDNVRVDAKNLRARVIGEGGNLGLTQAARVEFALAGGLIFSDAIDNSAGVDCSDHEVNIKILLDCAIKNGDLTERQRNELLAQMQDDVKNLVLKNNYLQTQILAMNRASAQAMFSAQSRMLLDAKLDRAREGLPSDQTLQQRQHQGLVAPEVAILLAHSKITLNQALLKSDLPDDAVFFPLLKQYFPQVLQEKFAAHLSSHYLQREIIANQLANHVVNRMGVTFIFRMCEDSTLPPETIVRAFWIAKDIFNAEHYWQAIEALDYQVSADVQMEWMIAVRALVERATRQLLRARRLPLTPAAAIEKYRDTVHQLLNLLPTLITQATDTTMTQQRYIEAGLATDLAAFLARVDFAAAFLDIADLANEANCPPQIVAQHYFALGQALSLDDLRDAITALPRDNRWQSLARSALRDDVFALHENLTRLALHNQDWSSWLASRAQAFAACKELLSALRTETTPDLAMLSAVIRELENRLMV